MGQAQRDRQRSVQHREVELWEMYSDWEEDVSRNDRDHRSNTGNRSRNRTGKRSNSYERNRTNSRAENRIRTAGKAGSKTENRSEENRQANRINQNIRLYEQPRSTGGSRNGSGTKNQRPGRELQVQDIRRYQGVRTEDWVNTRSVYRGNARPVQSIKRRKARKRKVYFTRAASLSLVVLCLVMIYFLTGEIYQMTHRNVDQLTRDDSGKGLIESLSDQLTDEGLMSPEIIEDYLEVNDFSRPGTGLKAVNNIFVHYTANPGTSAAQNRSYFANLALTQERSASAHLIIGYEGEIVQCIPLDEQAYAVMTRNEDSLSIECCYVSDDGSFTQETYDSLVHTLAWLIDKYDLTVDDIMRHYDCGGKMCPIYYVEHEDAWNRLLQDVSAYKDTEGNDI